ncbi:MAG: PqqD family protein [Chthonomonadales bacterium]|nr:PqqD family protein [Chthonomonadales bacterium]
MRVPLGELLQYYAARYLPFVRAKQVPDRGALMGLRPVRNDAITWEENESGEAELSIPYRKDRFAKAVAFLVHLPEARRVQLDEVGTFVWKLCDGSNTVEGIVRAMTKHYKMNRAEVEASVGRYLQMLAERRFIGFYRRGGAQR